MYQLGIWVVSLYLAIMNNAFMNIHAQNTWILYMPVGKITGSYSNFVFIILRKYYFQKEKR